MYRTECIISVVTNYQSCEAPQRRTKDLEEWTDIVVIVAHASRRCTRRTYESIETELPRDDSTHKATGLGRDTLPIAGRSRYNYLAEPKVDGKA